MKIVVKKNSEQKIAERGYSLKSNCRVYILFVSSVSCPPENPGDIPAVAVVPAGIEKRK